MIEKKLVTVPVHELVPYENNPRKNDSAVEKVKESIRQCEYITPIIVDEYNVILAGHTRLKAFNEMHVDSIEVMVVSGLTDEQKSKYRLLDNKTGEFAEWDFNALALELEGLDFEGVDFGFDDDIGDEFGTDFSLPDGDKPEMCTMSFQLHTSQKELIEYALGVIGEDVEETFGNTNKNGNALYEVVRQWAERRK